MNAKNCIKNECYSNAYTRQWAKHEHQTAKVCSYCTDCIEMATEKIRNIKWAN